MTQLSTKILLRIFHIIIFITGLNCVLINAQSYTLTPSSGTFTPLSGVTTEVFDIEQDNDAISSAIPIGFTFNYLGNSYTSLIASSNGFLDFDLTPDLDVTGTGPENVISNCSDPIIAPLWDNLIGSNGSEKASYITTGSAPNRVFAFEWLNWNWSAASSSATISFQVKLYETSNKIEFIYRREAGVVTIGNASIGLVGDTSSKFYSLLSPSSATLDLVGNGNDLIATKPANGQIYTFNATAASAPTSQASNIFSLAAGTSLSLNWTNGNGSYRAVFVKKTISTSEIVPVVDGTKYVDSLGFGKGTQVGSTGWYCVYNGTGTAANVTGLESGVEYRIHVVEYNGIATAQNYLTTTATNNPINSSTVLSAPTTPVSTLSIWRASDTEVEFDLDEGDGTYRAIFMRATSSGGAGPVNNTIYTANTTFGLGTQIGTSGWYCVFNGTASGGITVKGLSPNTAYRIHAVDYNGSGGNEKYNATVVTNNPVQFTTLSSYTIPTYNLTSTPGAFTAIASATAVNLIETDEALSAAITLPFTFNFGGTTYTQLKASSNGFLTFNSFAGNIGSGAFNDNALTTSPLRSLVAPLWDDLSGAGGQASYVTTGSTPNRIFTFEWLNWKWNGTASANISFQVKLYETSNNIEFVYRQEAGALASASASIGMAFPNKTSPNFISLDGVGANPTASTLAEVSGIAAKPATGQVYKFSPGAGMLDQTITFDPIPDKEYGSGIFDLGATTTSGLQLIYSSANTSIATVASNGKVTLKAVGSTMITVSQPGNGSYNEATSVQQLLTVIKGNQTITCATIPNKSFGSGTYDLGASTNSGLTLSYSSLNPGIATVSSGGIVTIVGIGSTTITISQAGNANYNAASVDRTITVIKGNQTITCATIPTKSFGSGTYDLGASTNSGLTLSYSSLNPAIATVSSGGIVTLVGIGSTTITISQAGNANYNAASVDRTITIIKGNQTITCATIPTQSFELGTYNLGASTNSGLTLSYSSLNPAIATVLSGGIVTFVGVGSTTITVSQAGNANYNAASVDRTLTVIKGNQTITFLEIPTKAFSQEPFQLEASASSELPVSYTSLNTNIATVSVDGEVTMVGVGSVTIRASQTGNANYNEATSVDKMFTITIGSQTITFDPLPSKATNDEPFQLKAKASSDLPITYMSSVPGVATVSGDIVTIIGAGTTIITASQPGNGNYNAALSVIQPLLVKVKQDQTIIAFENISDKTMGDAPFSLNAEASSSLTVKFTSASDPDKITINANMVTLVSPGSVTITAEQEGNDDYRAAPSIDRTFCINPVKPSIVSVSEDTQPILTSSSSFGNQWFKDGVAIEDANDVTYKATTSGTYTVRVSVDNCSSVPSVGITTVVTGIEATDFTVKVFPNPTDGILIIDVSSLPSTKATFVSLFDVSGKALQTVSGRGILRMDLGSYKAGSYFINVKNGSKVFSKHISKK